MPVIIGLFIGRWYGVVNIKNKERGTVDLSSVICSLYPVICSLPSGANMPELPEVQTIVNDLNAGFPKKTF